MGEIPGLMGYCGQNQTRSHDGMSLQFHVPCNLTDIPDSIGGEGSSGSDWAMIGW